MLVGLIYNATLLIALSALYGIITRLKNPSLWIKKILSGFLFGGMSIVAMVLPIHHSPGVIYDGRSVVLVLAGLFGGGTVTAISVALAGAYRVYIGGAGMWAGIATIISCPLLGLAYRRSCGNTPQILGPLALYMLGLITHIVMLMCQLLLPWSTALTTIGRIWLPIMLVFPAATLLMGILLGNDERRIATELTLQENETSLRYAQGIAKMGSWEIDLINEKTVWSENLFSLYGLTPFEIEPTYEYFQ